MSRFAPGVRSPTREALLLREPIGFGCSAGPAGTTDRTPAREPIDGPPRRDPSAPRSGALVDGLQPAYRLVERGVQGRDGGHRGQLEHPEHERARRHDDAQVLPGT